MVYNGCKLSCYSFSTAESASDFNRSQDDTDTYLEEKTINNVELGPLWGRMVPETPTLSRFFVPETRALSRSFLYMLNWADYGLSNQNPQ